MAAPVKPPRIGVVKAPQVEKRGSGALAIATSGRFQLFAAQTPPAGSVDVSVRSRHKSGDVLHVFRSGSIQLTKRAGQWLWARRRFPVGASPTRRSRSSPT